TATIEVSAVSIPVEEPAPEEPVAAEPAAELEAADTAPRARKRSLRSGRDARVRRSGRTTDRRAIDSKPETKGETAGRAPAPKPSAPTTQPRGRSPKEDGDRGGRNQKGRGRDGRRDAKGRRDDSRGRSRHGEPPRVSKTTPIREVVREGQEVIVQIS